MIAVCPLCEGKRLEKFLRRSNVPVYQNLSLSSEAEARSVPRGELLMVVCCGCGFVFNQAFDPSKITYDEEYDNDQAHSAYFDAYMDNLTERIRASGVSGATIAEAGCGKGRFLRKLVAAGNRGIGFDTTYEGPLSEADGRLTFIRAYFDADATAIDPDAIVCRHVIEHVQSPISLLASLRAASARARVFFETPCVKWIFGNAVIWDFFYEHCSLFSADSFRFAGARAGFEVESVDHTFGGQYLWLTGRPGASLPVSPAGADEMRALAGLYARKCLELETAWIKRLEDLRRRGPIALWGAGGKGVAFANLLDPARRLLDCVVDINPNKQGRFVPVTGHSIVAPIDLVRLGVKTAVVLNPNYRVEVESQIAATGAKIEIVEGL